VLGPNNGGLKSRLGVAREEIALVLQAVGDGVALCVLDGLRHTLNAQHLPRSLQKQMLSI